MKNNSSINDIVARIWKNSVVRQRVDGYISLTDMAQANGKLFADWKRLKSTESYLETLSNIMGIPIMVLVEINVGGNPETTGTWGHRRVAIRFAQWCSDEFAVQVDCWVEELLLTGKVELLKEANREIEELKVLLSEQQNFRKTEHIGTVELSDKINESLETPAMPPMEITATEWLKEKLPKHSTRFKSRFQRNIADLYRMSYKETPKLQTVQVGSRIIKSTINVYQVPRDIPLLMQAFDTVWNWCEKQNIPCVEE